MNTTWSVLALTYLIELFTLVHYKQSIEPDPRLSPLFKDVFRFHWMEESQHAVLDELEWMAEDAERDKAVSDLADLVSAVGMSQNPIRIRCTLLLFVRRGFFLFASTRIRPCPLPSRVSAPVHPLRRSKHATWRGPASAHFRNAVRAYPTVAFDARVTSLVPYK